MVVSAPYPPTLARTWLMSSTTVPDLVASTAAILTMRVTIFAWSATTASSASFSFSASGIMAPMESSTIIE